MRSRSGRHDMVKRRLGRGLDFFLSSSDRDPSAKGSDSEQGETVTQAELSSLVPNPTQPRRDFPEKELEELANSIRSAGILQPILARRVGGKLQIIAGERRWRAAQLAGLERIPILLRDINDEQAAIIGLVENLHREDLNPIEKAQAFRRIQGLAKVNQEELAKQVGLDRSSVANFLRLLDLPDEVQAHVSRGTLSMGHARALLGLPTPDEQKLVAEEVLRRGLSVRQIEKLVQSMKSPKSGGQQQVVRSAASGKQQPPWLKEIEDNLEQALGTMVAVRYNKKRSHITIECIGRDEFERIYELLKAIEA